MINKYIDIDYHSKMDFFTVVIKGTDQKVFPESPRTINAMYELGIIQTELKKK